MSAQLVYRRRRRAHSAHHREVWALVLVAGFLGLLALFMAGGVAVASVGVVYSYARNTILRDLPDPAQLGARPLAQVTRIYDRTGKVLLHEFFEERRINVPLQEVSPHLVRATLAAEDVSFFSHRGFDPRGIARAFLADLTRKPGQTVQGASTITQQLVKLRFLTPEVTIQRKLRELALAVQVEALFSKSQILEMYLNRIDYGNLSYGVEAASLSYFGKHARDLNLAEASILAGIPRGPSLFSPVINRRAALRRQREVLNNMVRYGMISAAEAAAARRQGEQMHFRAPRVDIRHPHFVFYVREVLNRVVQPEDLRRGLKVITTLDLDLQEKAEAAVRRRVEQLRPRHVNNGALVALRPDTGEILAMVGSYDFYNEEIDGQVNVALAPRQPGSAFKVFTYATAFSSGKWTPASTILDAPVEYDLPTERFKPRNYDNKFHGEVTLRTALANSYNIPAVKLLDQVGVERVIATAKALGITTELPPVLSLTLGSGSVRLLDMTAAYAVFANNGLRYDPSPILRITDRDDRLIWELRPRGKPVLMPEVAFLVTDILADEHARRAMFGRILDVDRPAAVKTGTTNDYRDSWTIGYTPDLVAGAWVGNTDNSEMLRVPGSRGAGVIWRDFMQAALAGQPPQRFLIPPGIVQSAVCGYPEYFLRTAVPTAEQCHTEAASAESGGTAALTPTPALPPSELEGRR